MVWGVAKMLWGWEDGGGQGWVVGGRRGTGARLLKQLCLFETQFPHVENKDAGKGF